MKRLVYVSVVACLTFYVGIFSILQTSVASAENRPQLRILYAEADLSAGTATIQGENFVHIDDSNTSVILNGDMLSVTSVTNAQISAQLPVGTTEGDLFINGFSRSRYFAK